MIDIAVTGLDVWTDEEVALGIKYHYLLHKQD